MVLSVTNVSGSAGHSEDAADSQPPTLKSEPAILVQVRTNQGKLQSSDCSGEAQYETAQTPPNAQPQPLQYGFYWVKNAGIPKEIAALRAEASRVRRLATGLTQLRDQALLQDYADEMEAKAEDLEAAALPRSSVEQD